MPLFIVFQQVAFRITNALLYQLSYSGVFRISDLGMPRRIIRSKCSGFCAYF